MSTVRAAFHAKLSRGRIVMKQEDVIASVVSLAHPIKVLDRQGNEETLETVGDATNFLLVNFSRARSADVDWKFAASALERAADTDTAYHVCTQRTR
jgi:hypothetical protein